MVRPVISGRSRITIYCLYIHFIKMRLQEVARNGVLISCRLKSKRNTQLILWNSTSEINAKERTFQWRDSELGRRRGRLRLSAGMLQCSDTYGLKFNLMLFYIWPVASDDNHGHLS